MPDETAAQPDPDENEPIDPSADDDAELGAEDAGEGKGPVWQIPLLAASVVMLAAGLYLSVQSAPGPDFDGALDSIEFHLRAGDYEQWQSAIEDLAPHLPQAARAEQVARFYLLKGDGHHQKQRDQGIQLDGYSRLVIDAYEKASQELSGSLGGSRHANLAEAYLAVGRTDDAIGLADGLPESHAHRRHNIYKTLIDQRLSGSHPDHDGGIELLDRLLKDPALPAEVRTWAFGRRAETLLDQGYAEQAMASLLRDIQRVESEDATNLGELLALLGRAYFEYGDHDSADKYLRRAEERLDDNSPAYPRVLVYLARLDQAAGKIIDARDTYTIVMRDYGGADAYDAALLGRAETNAAMQLHDEALADFRQLISRQQWQASGPRQVNRHAILESMTTEHRKRVVEEDFERALELAELSQELFIGEEIPEDVLLIVADSHRARAENLLRDAVGETGEPDRLLLVEPPLRRTIRRHFSLAGDAYVRHARRMTLENNFAYGESLWLAANSYDRAGDHREAIDAFQEYLQSRDSDVREPAARYRLGRLYQARGDYDKARTFFEELISGKHRTSQEARASYVPLAQCLLQVDAVKNYEAAERSLLFVLEGVELSPEAGEFRDALIELGIMYFRAQDYPRAVERLEESVARYPDLSRTLELKFKLAESYRLEASRLTGELEVAMRQSERTSLEATRASHLIRAGELYGEVREEFAARDPRRLTNLEAVMLRESYFYKADCLSALGEFDEAIKEYNIAIGHYGDHPASLFASVQKVNAYVALGRYKDARTAHQSARLRLQALTDDDFRKPEFNLMTRRQWEDWLDSIMLIEDRTQATAPGG